MEYDPSPGRLADRVRRELQRDDGAPDRVRSVVTETVPSPIPGEILVCFARAGPDRTAIDDALDAAVAVEFASLHQYLHAIPAASASLVAPARDSPYADDEVAAIIDGDWLQAAAFGRLSGSVRTPAKAHRCYAALAAGSTSCYELSGRETASDLPARPPLIAAAGRIGGIVGGLDREAATTVTRVARSVGESVRPPTPTDAAGASPTPSPDWTAIADDLAGAVARPGAVVDVLQDVVECGRTSGGIDG